MQENIQCEKEENSKKDFFSEDIKIDAIELMRYIDTLDGYNFEKVCAYILCCNGYINICVTSGSKDRGIIAEKDGMKYAVQCKHYSSNVGNHAVQEAFSGKSIYNADVAVVLTNSYFTQQAEQDARTLCVELWNRKYSIYKNVRVCTFVRVIYIHTFSWKFLKNLFHGSTVDLYPLWHKAFKCGTQVPRCSTVPRFLEENYGTKAISSRMY